MSRPGYGFAGWHLGADGAEVTPETLVTSAGDHTLVAAWAPTAAEYAVRYLQADGTPLAPEKIASGIVGGAATETAISIPGYTPVVMGKSLTLAVADNIISFTYEANAYTVTFDAHGGTASPEQIIAAYHQPYGELPAAIRKGYTFAGWFTAEKDGTVVTDGTILSTTADHTLHAIWTADAYTVAFNTHGGEPSPESIIVTFDVPYGQLPEVSRPGYTFAGWYQEGSDSEVTPKTIVANDAGHVLHARWMPAAVE